MRYYLDTEFIDRGGTIDLVSIGVVAEDGRELYAISRDFDPADANAWVREHVLPQLEPPDSGLWKTNAAIRDELLAFVGADEPAFWVWGGGMYDWLAVIGLLGGGERLPEGWRYWAYELMQWCRQLGLETDDPRLPRQPEGAHNALADARFNRVRYEFLERYQEEWIAERARSRS